MRRPWSDVVIDDCGEPLVALKPQFLCLEPHPYACVGAPYGEDADPYRLRSGVLKRLVTAQQLLSRRSDPEVGDLQLAIFDAWRPIRVQAFMVDHSIQEQCRSLGFDPSDPLKTQALEQVRNDVARFWAPPSPDPRTPPPHSTGGAVDLTLADSSGEPLEMGGEIDAIGEQSVPDHHAEEAESNPEGTAALWHGRRCLLNDVNDGGGVRKTSQ
ncbi:M15 family metallopeptidase [Synechococcus sp. MIT S9503]|uniref:M15 family metallopeptidase n=1 Tax=Synechococcus sp. MIT S9503 TaxID=3082547 RepID=UPI0039A732E5